MGKQLIPGDVAPWFHGAAMDGNPRYSFDTAAGRFIVLLFLGSAAWQASRAALDGIERHRALFDDTRACLFGVTIDPADSRERRIAPSLPGIRWFLDHDRAVSQLYGAEVTGEKGPAYQPHWLLLDPMLRVVAREPIDRGEAILDRLETMLALEAEPQTAPVLIVPRILEPALCRRLIDAYRQDGGSASGFMHDEGGVTVLRTDPAHKRRSDFVVEEEGLRGQIIARLKRFLDPMITRAFQFEPTRVERLLIGCYDGDGDGGYFHPHRDNTTTSTAHRRFACTINLNAEEYEGGDLRFPEFGPRTYRAPTGGAAVFSCGLLHEALPVTRGRRYALLPFFYDEAAAALRERNTAHVSAEFAGYRATAREAPR